MYQYHYQQPAQGGTLARSASPYASAGYPSYSGQPSSLSQSFIPSPPQPLPYSSSYQQLQPSSQSQPYYGNVPNNESPPPFSYGTPAIYHQQQPNYPPPQPAPPPLPYNLGTDPNTFRGYYLHELRELMFNSKPIINGLTILAQEHAQRMGPIVAQCLDEHIRQAPPNLKLPALYLLDSICKNVGAPYTALLSRSIDRIFLAAYREVDQSTKVKLEELLGTWRNGAPDGGEVFQLQPNAPLGTLPPQQVMEEALFGRRPEPPPLSYQSASLPLPPMPMPPAMPLQAQNPYQHQQSAQTPQAGATSNIERAAVLFDLRKLLGIRREQASANPADQSNFDQIATLQQYLLRIKLETLVLQTPLGSAQILQIREQLARLTPSQHSRIGTPPILIKNESEAGQEARGKKRQRLMSPPPPMRSSPQPPSLFLPNPSLASLASTLNPNIIRAASAQGMRRDVTPPLIVPSQLPVPLLAPVPISSQPLSIVAKSLQDLESGISSTLAEGTAANNAAAAATAQHRAYNDAALDAYERHRCHFHVRLQNNDIARYRPGSHALLYEAMPLRCKQCGNRYLDCPLGKERLDKDLDRHLRISRRYTEGVGAQRAVGRSWFATEEEWVLPSHAIVPSEAVVKTEEAKKVAAATAELLNKTVPVPAEAATNDESRRCPICKEEFKNEYSEEDEDWVWRNAIEFNGHIYHASCKAEEIV